MIKHGWYVCPFCSTKVQKVDARSNVENLPLYCKKCHLESYPTIFHGKELGDDDPFPGLDAKHRYST